MSKKFIFIGQKVSTQCVIVRPEPPGWRGRGVAQVGEVSGSLPKEVGLVVSEKNLGEATHVGERGDVIDMFDSSEMEIRRDHWIFTLFVYLALTKVDCEQTTTRTKRCSVSLCVRKLST